MGCGGSKPTGAEASATDETKADDAVAVEEVQAEVDADAEPDIPEATQIFDPFKGNNDICPVLIMGLHMGVLLCW